MENVFTKPKRYLCTTTYYSCTTPRTTPYYKVVQTYDSVLQSTTAVLLIRRSTTDVRLHTTKYYSRTTHTTKYYSRTTPYSKVLQPYFSVLQSTTAVLQRTTKYYCRTSPYYKVLQPYFNVLQSTTAVLIRTTTYYNVLQSTTAVLLRTTRLICGRGLVCTRGQGPHLYTRTRDSSVHAEWVCCMYHFVLTVV